MRLYAYSTRITLQKDITSCTAQIQMKDLITDKVYSQKVKGNEAGMCEGVRVLKVQN